MKHKRNSEQPCAKVEDLTFHEHYSKYFWIAYVVAGLLSLSAFL